MYGCVYICLLQCMIVYTFVYFNVWMYIHLSTTMYECVYICLLKYMGVYTPHAMHIYTTDSCIRLPVHSKRYISLVIIVGLGSPTVA